MKQEIDGRRARQAAPHSVRLAAIPLIAAGLLVAACSSSATTTQGSASPASGQVATLTYNVGSKSTEAGNVYVAEARGLFKQQGLNVKLIYSASSQATILLSHAAQITSGTPISTYTAQAQGAKIVGIYSQGPTFEGFIGRNITSPKQLAGKTIGVYSLQDLDVFYTQEMMSQYGVSPNAYHLLTIGFSSAKLAAVLAGKVAAAPVYPPSNTQGVAQGLKQFFTTSQLKVGEIPTLMIAESSWAAANRSVVVRFLTALDKANAWMHDKSHEAEAVRIIAAATQIPQSQVKEQYPLYFLGTGPSYSVYGDWSDSVVEQMVPFLKSSKLLTSAVPYEQTIDKSYLNAAKASVTKG